MTSHIRIRPSALVIQNEAVLLVEYHSEQRGIIYYIPGGGAEAADIN